MTNSSGKSNPHIKQLWPVSILSRRFGKYQKVNPELIELFRQYQKEHPATSGSVYSSPDNFSHGIENEALQSLEKFIMDNIFSIASELNAPYWKHGMSLDVTLTGLWFQVSNNFGFHEMHVHGNCSWSGVYYVQAGESSSSAETLGSGRPNGITRFYGPHMEYMAGGHGDYGNFYVQDSSWDSYPQDGKLCIFPSHLKHMVYPYNGEKDRVIVSFHAQVHNSKGLQYNYSFGN